MPRAGREWRRTGDPVRVRDHDFADRRRRARDPVRGLRRRRERRVRERGHRPQHRRVRGGVHPPLAAPDRPGRLPGRRPGCWSAATCRRVQRLASNRALEGRARQLARKTGLEITCCHFPPGTSSGTRSSTGCSPQITLAWRVPPADQPRRRHQHHQPRSLPATGLTVTAVLDREPLPRRDPDQRRAGQRHRRPPLNTPRLPRRVELHRLPVSRPAPRNRTGHSQPVPAALPATC